MKIVIAYASTGGGHFKCAEAIYNYFKERNPQLELKLVDTLSYSNFLFRGVYYYGYTFLINYLPWLWAICFYATRFKYLPWFSRILHALINRPYNKRFNEFLISENPDFIISTHFLPSEATSYLKRKGLIKSKLLTVITDFGVHPFWITKGVDNYIVASDFVKDELARLGVGETKIKAIGIPVDPKFIKAYDKDALRQKFGVTKDKFTALLITGSFGIGPLEQIVDMLHKDMQVLVVCAKNKKLFNNLTYKGYTNAKIFGFVDNVEELMAISDVIVTKPGGLSISELLAMDLVPIFIAAIAGQETHNALALSKYGVGVKPKKIKDIRGVILNYINNPLSLKKIKGNIKRIQKQNTLEDLYNAIC